MEYINNNLFLLINGTDPSSTALFIGKVLAKYVVYIFPLYLFLSWFRSDTSGREALIQATITATVAIFISWFIAKFYFHPRPFVTGIGNQFLDHKPTASFPSNHLSFIWAICAGLYIYKVKRTAAIILAIIGLPVAWARIFMGVHYPFDMLGAFVNALLAGFICMPLRNKLTPIIRSIFESIYRVLFGWLIKSGWAKY